MHALHNVRNEGMLNRMFHNVTFFEIKNAWGLIRSDLGHNEEITNFFNYSLFLDAGKFFDIFHSDIFGRGEIFLTSAISPQQNEIESNVWYQNLQIGQLPICSQYILDR